VLKVPLKGLECTTEHLKPYSSRGPKAAPKPPAVLLRLRFQSSNRGKT